MSVDEIVRYGDQVLRRRTELVDEVNDEIRSLIQHMYKVMEEAPGVGLSANQIGIPKRLFVYNVGEGNKALVNPKLISSSGEHTATEGCLSIPGLQGDVRRPSNIVVEGLDENGDPVQITAEGLLARVFQHEIDHLNGLFFVDRADPDSLEFVLPTGQVNEGEEIEE